MEKLADYFARLRRELAEKKEWQNRVFKPETREENGVKITKYKPGYAQDIRPGLTANKKDS